MTVCIKCGKWNKKYIFIIISTILLLIYKFFFGFVFDGEDKYEINVFDNGIFKENIIIHQIFIYLFCIFFSLILIIYSQKEKNKNLHKQLEDIIFHEYSINKQYSGSLVKDLNLIYREYYDINKKKYSNIFIIITIFSYILLELFKIIFKKFFIHMDFWMIELYIFAFLNLKIFKLQIYKHQILAFIINLLSILLSVITVVITIIEGDADKALYVKYWWAVFIGIIIYILYAIFLSYNYISLKKIIDLKLISFHLLIFLYGVFGFFFNLCFCIISTFIPNENADSKYLYKVKDDNNKTFIDNFFVYYNNFGKSRFVDDKKNEGVTIAFGGFIFAFYKYSTLKIFEELTPLHKIFSYPVYYFFQKFILLCSKGNMIFSGGNKYLKSKLILELSADFLSIIGYLIYLEIIEINIFGLNFNLRKNIIRRGEQDSSLFDSEYILNIEEESYETDNEYSCSSVTQSNEIYQ